jgi:hypothetical protein
LAGSVLARSGHASGAGAVVLPDGRRIDLRPGARATIGRANCDVILGDPSTPLEAAILIPQPDGRIALRNTSGAVKVNGDFVLNDRVLDDGARIQIGNQTLSFIAPAVVPSRGPSPQPSSGAAGMSAPAPAPINPAANLPQSGLGGLIQNNPTGGPLIQQGANPPAVPAAQPMPPATIHNQQPNQPVNIPTPQSKYQLRNWQGQRGGPPFFEGVVDNIDGPHTAHSRPSLWKQITAAMVLGKMSPWMGMGAMQMGNKDYHVWTCRLRLDPAYYAANNGSPSAMIFVLNNQPQAGFQLGDMIAVWGKPDKDGNLVMQKVYDYDTNSWLRLKK